MTVVGRVAVGGYVDAEVGVVAVADTEAADATPPFSARNSNNKGNREITYPF